jgi:hypothetical protein
MRRSTLVWRNCSSASRPSGTLQHRVARFAEETLQQTADTWLIVNDKDRSQRSSVSVGSLLWESIA